MAKATNKTRSPKSASPLELAVAEVERFRGDAETYKRLYERELYT